LLRGHSVYGCVCSQESGLSGTGSGEAEAVDGTVITLSTGAAVLFAALAAAVVLHCCWPRACCCGRCRCACPQPPNGLMAQLDLLKVQLVSSGDQPRSGAGFLVKGVSSTFGGVTTLAALVAVFFLVIAFIVQVRP
jgi:hypothetical protein